MSEYQNILQIDTDAELQKIMRQLNSLPDQLKAPSVLATALNATANEMKRAMGKKARKKYAITDDRILKERKRGGMFLERATGTTLEAGLISKGTITPCTARPRGTAKGGNGKCLISTAFTIPRLTPA